MNLNRHVWEGWTAQGFIDELKPSFEVIMSGRSWQKPFRTSDELKKWCKDNQPGYKKHVPEVYAYFKNEMNRINYI